MKDYVVTNIPHLHYYVVMIVTSTGTSNDRRIKYSFSRLL